MFNRFLRDDINRLVNKDSRPGPHVPGVPTPVTLSESRGVGLPATQSSGSPVIGTVRMEVITVWSSLIITEDGAFEMPAGWPDSGDYPAGAFMADPPASISISGGIYSLDTGAAYYQQKRVHLVVFQDDAGTMLAEDRFLVPLAAPFLGQGYMQGLSSYTQGNFPIGLNVDYIDGIGQAIGLVETRLDEIIDIVGAGNATHL